MSTLFPVLPSSTGRRFPVSFVHNTHRRCVSLLDVSTDLVSCACFHLFVCSFVPKGRNVVVERAVYNPPEMEENDLAVYIKNVPSRVNQRRFKSLVDRFGVVEKVK